MSNWVIAYNDRKNPFSNTSNGRQITLEDLTHIFERGIIAGSKYNDSTQAWTNMESHDVIGSIVNKQLRIDIKCQWRFSILSDKEPLVLKTGSQEREIKYISQPGVKVAYLEFNEGDFLPLNNWSLKYKAPPYYITLAWRDITVQDLGSLPLPFNPNLQISISESFSKEYLKDKWGCQDVIMSSTLLPITITRSWQKPILGGSPIRYTVAINDDVKIRMKDNGNKKYQKIYIGGKDFYFDNDTECTLTKSSWTLSQFSDSVSCKLYCGLKVSDNIENYRYEKKTDFSLQGSGVQNVFLESVNVDDWFSAKKHTISNFAIQNQNFNMTSWIDEKLITERTNGNFNYNYMNKYDTRLSKNAYMWFGVPKVVFPDVIYQDYISGKKISWSQDRQILTVDHQNFNFGSSGTYQLPILFFMRTPVTLEATVTQPYGFYGIEDRRTILFGADDEFENKARISVKPESDSKLTCYILSSDTKSFKDISINNLDSVLPTTSKFNYLKKVESFSDVSLTSFSIGHNEQVSIKSVSTNPNKPGVGYGMRMRAANFGIFFSDRTYERLWCESKLQLTSKMTSLNRVQLWIQQDLESWGISNQAYSLLGWCRILSAYYSNIPGLINNMYTSWDNNFFDWSEKNGPSSNQLHNIMLNRKTIDNYVIWNKDLWEDPAIKNGSKHAFPARALKSHQVFYGWGLNSNSGIIYNNNYPEWYLYFDGEGSEATGSSIKWTDAATRYSLYHNVNNRNGYIYKPKEEWWSWTTSENSIPFIEFTPSCLILESENTCSSEYNDILKMHVDAKATPYRELFNKISTIVRSTDREYLYITAFQKGVNCLGN